MVVVHLPVSCVHGCLVCVVQDDYHHFAEVRHRVHSTDVPAKPSVSNGHGAADHVLSLRASSECCTVRTGHVLAVFGFLAQLRGSTCCACGVAGSFLPVYVAACARGGVDRP